MFRKKILPPLLAASVIVGLGAYLYSPSFLNNRKDAPPTVSIQETDRELVLERLQKKTEEEQNSLALPKSISDIRNKEESDEVQTVVWEAQEEETTEFFASPARTMKVTQGAPISLILQEDAVIEGLELKEGTKLLGTAILKGDRCHIFVTAAQVGVRTKRINMVVLGLDFLEGIYCKDLRSEMYDEAERVAVNEILATVHTHSFQRAAALSKTLYSTYKGRKRKALLRKTTRFYVSVIEKKK